MNAKLFLFLSSNIFLARQLLIVGSIKAGVIESLFFLVRSLLDSKKLLWMNRVGPFYTPSHVYILQLKIDLDYINHNDNQLDHVR